MTYNREKLAKLLHEASKYSINRSYSSHKHTSSSWENAPEKTKEIRRAQASFLLARLRIDDL